MLYWPSPVCTTLALIDLLSVCTSWSRWSRRSFAGWPVEASALEIWSFRPAICCATLLTELICVCTCVLTWFDSAFNWPAMELKRLCRPAAAFRNTWRAVVLDGLDVRPSAPLKKLVSAELRPLLLSDMYWLRPDTRLLS